jgi:hypothetical protein
MKIQYISTTHISKEEAKKHKREVNTFHNVYYKDASFEEIAELLDAGCTIARVGNTTEFIAIDVDKTSININTVYEHYKDNPDYAISYSASNNPLKWHMLINLHRTISREEYKEEVHKLFEKISNELRTKFDFIELDTNADKFDQCFFGQSVDNRVEYILPNSVRMYKWCKQGEEIVRYVAKEVKVHPSLNSADYCKKNGLLTVKEEKRFDIYLPSMSSGKMKKIAEGYRWNWCRMIGTKVLMRIFHLNHQFNENWTKFDFLDTVEWIFRSNIVNPASFEDDMKKLLLWLDNKYDILVTKTYEEQCKTLEPYFDCSKKQYKSRSYNSTTMSNLIMEHQFDDHTIVFTDKEDLKNICSELLIDYYKFIKFAKGLGFDVEFEVVIRKSKHNCSGMSIEQFNEYCKINNISKQQKYQLKKKYEIGKQNF